MRVFYCTLLFIILAVFGFASCYSSNSTEETNNTIISKEQKLVDEMLDAMGGEEPYNSLRHVSWDFFGARQLLWDKHTGNVRIDYPRDSTVFLINVEADSGRVFRNGMEILQKDSLAYMVRRGKSIWINDSYWLVMPFKLKDEGVKLKLLSSDSLINNKATSVLEVTFENVGDTPENKYHIYIDKETKMIFQWAYFKNVNQEEPTSVWPWDNYHTHKGVLFSYDRSDGNGPHDVRVYETLPDEFYKSPVKPNYPNK